MIELRNVSLTIAASDRIILKNISWRIARGEHWVLFGRNGAGKTKLLEIMTGYHFPSEGEVFRFGQPALGNDIREIRKRIGYVSSPLRETIPHRETALSVVLSGLYATIGLYVEPGRPEKERAMALMEETGIAERAFDLFSVLSDGEKQKILMLRSLINDPDFMIFDEPAAHLDLGAREEFLTTVERLSQKQSLSIIYVTHRIEEILPVFSDIFILHGGECLYCGEIGEGLNGATLSRIFGRTVEVSAINGRYYPIVS